MVIDGCRVFAIHQPIGRLMNWYEGDGYLGRRIFA